MIRISLEGFCGRNPQAQMEMHLLPQTAAQWIRTISDPGRRREAVTAALSNVGPEDLNRVRILVGAMED
jgi:hypothetical protein